MNSEEIKWKTYQQQIQAWKKTEKNISKAFFVDKTFNPTPLEEKALDLANACDFEICEVEWNGKKAYLLYDLQLGEYHCEKHHNDIDEFLASNSFSQIKDIPTIMEAYCIDYGFDYDKVCNESILDIEQCFNDESIRKRKTQ